jgi:hypothetical protein
MDLDQKKTFLQQGAALYGEMIKLTTNDVVRRYLAFRIIVNAMSFEDIVGNRQHLRMRNIRDVLLAHKQEPEFFEGHRAADEITDQAITPLLDFMAAETGPPDPAGVLPELSGGIPKVKFENLVPRIFDLYEKEFLAGHRVINNFLCFTGSGVQEVTTGDLAGAFYRYHSSKALYDLSEYIFNNARLDADLAWLARHTRLDMLLHAQNMADCAIKDTRNRHSIDGILEVMVADRIGDPASLQALASDPVYQAVYARVRTVRNKLIGHMDRAAPLADLVAALDALPETDTCDLVNMVDKAVHTAARSHIAIFGQYITGNQVLDDPAITDIAGIQTRPYY